MKIVVLAIFLLGTALAHPAPSPRGLDMENMDLIMGNDGKIYIVNGKVQVDPEVETLFYAPEDVEFHLYTRSNPTTYQRLVLNSVASVENSNFDARKPTRFIIHGWNNNGASDVNRVVRNALLEKADVNVIVVDWGAGANHLVYSVSRGRIDSVAEVAAQMIDFLARYFGLSPANVVVSGHSLGGHTAGLVGKKVTVGKVGRVVAMDPAGPLFSVDSPGERVHSTDADYVEVIHTNAGLLGFDKPVGDVDIYPNWGSSQTGCGLDVAGTCAHSRAFEYYAESITTTTGFKATKCVDYNEISNKKCTGDGTILLGGEPVPIKPSGVYYVATNKNSPYAQ